MTEISFPDQTTENNKGYAPPSFYLKSDFRLFRYGYSLIIKPTYCGATSTSLTPREGEDWLRGNDLRDGKLYKLPLVLWDIICYEMNWGRWGFKNKS